MLADQAVLTAGGLLLVRLLPLCDVVSHALSETIYVSVMFERNVPTSGSIPCAVSAIT
jgi:hypothetical protein